MKPDPRDLARARWVNVVLGGWLVVSSVLWPHAAAQRLNTLLGGLLVTAFGALAVRHPGATKLNTVLSVWLFVSAFALPGSLGTRWTNALCALAIFAVSLSVPPGGRAVLRTA